MRFPIMSRFDSRGLLKFLILFNLTIAIYQIVTFHFSYKTESCVLNLKPSSLEQTNHLKAVPYPVLLDSFQIDNNNLADSVNSVNSPRNLKAESSEINEANNVLSSSSSKPKSIWWTHENRSSYIVLRNYVQSSINASAIDPDSVTLSTQGTYEFLNHVENLCQRWDGPVSVAVYAPGDDFQLCLKLIYFMRECRHVCVKKNVSWHIIYDLRSGPDPEKVLFPDEMVNPSNYNCSMNYEKIYSQNKSVYRVKNKLPYPINVARNVARLSAKTKYLLASDIELYPSINIVKMFKKLLEKERNNQVPNIDPKVPHVYVLPIFEVKANMKPPLTKKELTQMLKKNDAIFFHKLVCDVCQNFPDRIEWIDSLPEDTLNIFRATKRISRTWEPLYIGTNDEPLYEERLSWDGKRDKMSQMFEMCLLDYDLLILDNAFLVHAPGIKHIDMNDQKKRLPFINRNNKVYNTLISKLSRKYGGKNKRC